MNIVAWVVQILLAFHTATGAVWKFTNSEQAVPSLKALPHSVWLGLSGIELLASLCLVLPAWSRAPSILAPLAAAGIAAEMLLFCGLHLRSGDPSYGPLVYWLVVATLCGLLACARLMLAPR